MSIIVDIDVKCEECGDLLDYEQDEKSSYLRIIVTPCPRCLQRSYEDGNDRRRSP